MNSFRSLLQLFCLMLEGVKGKNRRFTVKVSCLNFTHSVHTTEHKLQLLTMTAELKKGHRHPLCLTALKGRVLLFRTSYAF